MRLSSIAFVAGFAGALAACGGAPDHADGGVADLSGLVTCEGDPRVDVYTANLMKKSASGAYRIVLAKADPGPPAIGVNAWTIRAEDAAGTATPSATLRVLPFMPDHGHGTSVKAQISSLPDGAFSVTPLYFFMGGVWRVEFNPAAGDADPVDFYFCVPG